MGLIESIAFPEQDEGPDAPIVDVEKVLGDQAWESFLHSYSWCVHGHGKTWEWMCVGQCVWWEVVIKIITVSNKVKGMCLRSVCACMCVCFWEREYICVYVFVWVCVNVCVLERAYTCMYVNVCMWEIGIAIWHINHFVHAITGSAILVITSFNDYNLHFIFHHGDKNCTALAANLLFVNCSLKYR